MKLLFGIIVLILLIISAIYVAMLNPIQVSLTLPFIGTLTDLPLIVIILASILIGVLIAFIIVVLREFARSLHNMSENKKKRQQNFVDRLYNDGFNLFSAGRNTDAMVHFNKVLARDPDHVYAYVGIGDIYSQENNFDRAIENHLKAHRLKEDNVDILLKLVDDYEKSGRHSEAVQPLKQIIKIDNHNLYANLKMREILIKQENWVEAEQVQKKIISLTKDRKQKYIEEKTQQGIMLEYASQLKTAQEYSDAEEIFCSLVKEDKAFIPAYLELADLLFLNNQRVEAVKELEKALKHSVSVILLRELEKICLEQEDPSRIIALYHTAISKQPDDSRLNLLLGQLYLRLEMLDEAIEQFEEVINKGEDFPALHIYKGELHQRQGHYDKACEEFRLGFDHVMEQTLYYSCGNCSYQSPGYLKRCPRCSRWNEFDLKSSV